MDQLLALVVVVPLLVAATVTACGPLLRNRRRILDVAPILTAAAVAVMLFVIMIRTAGGDQVYWFAGFRPAHGVSIGIDFEVQPLSAGLACLAAVLVTAAMTFSWRYFDQVATYYHALMLTFLAGITGFCLTGDLFDLFVWFELMGVSAYALTAYRPEERGPIQGALNFAITNSIGATRIDGNAPARPSRLPAISTTARIARPAAPTSCWRIAAFHTPSGAARHLPQQCWGRESGARLPVIRMSLPQAAPDAVGDRPGIRASRGFRACGRGESCMR